METLEVSEEYYKKNKTFPDIFNLNDPQSSFSKAQDN